MLKKLTLFILFTLSACSTFNQNTQQFTDIPWQQRQESLSTITKWRNMGAIGITTQDQSLSAHFTWQQQSQTDYTIHLFGPLGINNNTLTEKQNQFSLTTSDGKIYTANDPEALMQQQLGYQLPVSNLYYWIRGLASPNQKSEKTFDQYHHIATLKQNGWNIFYTQYQAINKKDLPREIIMSQNKTKIKIVVTNWNLS